MHWPVAQNGVCRHCLSRYAAELKLRRDELKALALESLPVADIIELGLDTDDLLDRHAPTVVERLHACDVSIPPYLFTSYYYPDILEEHCYYRETRDPSAYLTTLPVYHTLRMEFDFANALWKAGFRDLEAPFADGSNVLENVMVPEASPWSDNNCKGPIYLAWIFRHCRTVLSLLRAPQKRLVARQRTGTVLDFSVAHQLLAYLSRHALPRGEDWVDEGDDDDKDEDEDENYTMVVDLYHQIVAELENTIACGYENYYKDTDDEGSQRDTSLPDFHLVSQTHDEFVAFFDKCASSSELADKPCYRRTRSMWRPWLERWVILVREGVERLKQGSLARGDLDNAADTGVVWVRPQGPSL